METGDVAWSPGAACESATGVSLEERCYQPLQDLLMMGTITKSTTSKMVPMSANHFQNLRVFSSSLEGPKREFSVVCFQ